MKGLTGGEVTLVAPSISNLFCPVTVKSVAPNIPLFVFEADEGDVPQSETGKSEPLFEFLGGSDAKERFHNFEI